MTLLEDYKNSIDAADITELIEVKNYIIQSMFDKQEVTDNHLKRFVNILGWATDRYSHLTYEERLALISKMTEKQFCNFRGVGESTIRAARFELAKKGLKFSEDLPK